MGPNIKWPLEKSMEYTSNEWKQNQKDVNM